MNEKLSNEPSATERLFDPAEFSPAAGAGRGARASARHDAKPLRDRLNDGLWLGINGVGRWSRRKWPARGLLAVAGVALLAGAIIAYDRWHVKPRPNFAVADLDDVLDYALMTEGFNKLPLQQRLDLIKQLVARMKGMSADDSALTAAFAAGIMGPARAQLQRNAERLAIDLWDSYSKDYTSVKPADRGAFLDQSIVDFTKTMEGIAGVESGLEDNERLSQTKSQAQRDAARAKERDPGLSADRVGGLFAFVGKQGEQVQDVRQRSRMARFSRDVTRHMRGQDVDTGRPKGP